MPAKSGGTMKANIHRRVLAVGWVCLGLVVTAQGRFEDPPNYTPGGLVPGEARFYGNLEYAKPDGHSLRLDLYLPKDLVEPAPVVVWIPGRDWDAANKKSCPISRFTKLGYAVASIEYRPSKIAPFPAPLHDCKAAIRWLRANASRFHLNEARIGAFGEAAGGHLAALLGTTGNVPELEGSENPGFSSRLQAVCVLYGPTDLVTLGEKQGPKGSVARLLGGPVAEKMALAELASPLSHVTRDDSPCYLYHGKRDRQVPEMQSILLYSALDRAGVRARLRFSSRGHGAWPSDMAFSDIHYFLLKNLAPQRLNPLVAER